MGQSWRPMSRVASQPIRIGKTKMVGREAASGLWCGAATNVGTPEKDQTMAPEHLYTGYVAGIYRKSMCVWLCVHVVWRCLEKLMKQDLSWVGLIKGTDDQCTGWRWSKASSRAKIPISQPEVHPTERQGLALMLLFESSGSGVTMRYTADHWIQDIHMEVSTSHRGYPQSSSIYRWDFLWFSIINGNFRILKWRYCTI